jgi:ABC-type Fe3+/spermidine/putrescine transport system ATPase subunit
MIEMNGLTKCFDGVPAVDDLTCAVGPGVVTGFVGPNGAGKSTTMRMILGLDLPSTGTATIGGRRYADLPSPMREVGALLDARAMHGGRTAYDHLVCLAESNRIPALAAADAPHAALGQTDVLRAILMTGPYLALIGQLAIAVGFLVRSTAGGITIVVASTILVPNVLLQVIGERAHFWPTLIGLVITSTINDPGAPSPWAGFGLSAASAMLAAAYTVFLCKDA